MPANPLHRSNSFDDRDAFDSDDFDENLFYSRYLEDVTINPGSLLRNKSAVKFVEKEKEHFLIQFVLKFRFSVRKRTTARVKRACRSNFQRNEKLFRLIYKSWHIRIFFNRSRLSPEEIRVVTNGAAQRKLFVNVRHQVLDRRTIRPEILSERRIAKRPELNLLTVRAARRTECRNL